MLKDLIRLTLIASLISCNPGKPKQEPVGKNIIALADSAATENSDMAAAAVKADEYYDNAEADSGFANYPLVDFSTSTYGNPAAILTTGLFHDEEVSKADRGRNWYALFQNTNGYYVDTARVVIKRASDSLADEEPGKLTGWLVETTNIDTSLLLFSGVNGLNKRQIKEVTLRKKEIQAGESVTYSYNGITYTLFATGTKVQEEPGAPVTVSNYRLFIKATINGTERTQMLVSARELDDRIARIIFAGDIDGDDIPDLIIDTSYHYNATVPTLYLSKPAGSNEVLKMMGWHVSAGC
ncbi:MAG TPA: hypothetical protein VIM79_17790 [Niastella sp.]